MLDQKFLNDHKHIIPAEFLNKVAGMKDEDNWPRAVKMKFIEPGLVSYGEGSMVLVKKPVLDKMLASIIGKPIFNINHAESNPTDFKTGKADGIVANAWYNVEDGWYWADCLIWDKKTRETCEGGNYAPSCAYKPTDWDGNGGVHNNVTYNQEILDGYYTHMAVVSNPRYEDALIVCNSKGGVDMKLMFWKKEKDKDGKEIANSIDIDPATSVEIDGDKVSMKDLISLHNAKSVAASLSDDSMLEVDGKTLSLKELKQNYLNSKKEKENEVGKTKDEEKLKEEDKEHSKHNSYNENCAMCNKEKKNAEDEEEKKKKDKENADEKEKKEKEEKEKQDKKNSLSHFDALKNAAERRKPENGAPSTTSLSRRDKAKLGRDLYGSGKK
jgi:Uncharacterized protein conserved in bacteria (DUF2213)